MANLDEDWIIFSNYIENSNNKDVIINGAQLLVDIQNKAGNIFDVLKGGDSNFKVNNDGVLVIKEHSSFPSVVDNAIIYKGGEFYIAS